jgi:hypothetical protein
VYYVSVRISHNISGGLLLGLRCFSPPLLPECIPQTLGEVIPPEANGHLDLEEGLVLLASQCQGLIRTMEPSEAQGPVRGVPPTRLERTQVQI